jgi:hypothetical protein
LGTFEEARVKDVISNVQDHDVHLIGNWPSPASAAPLESVVEVGGFAL